VNRVEREEKSGPRNPSWHFQTMEKDEKTAMPKMEEKLEKRWGRGRGLETRRDQKKEIGCRKEAGGGSHKRRTSGKRDSAIGWESLADLREALER